MELKDFIQKSLTDIVAGVEGASKNSSINIRLGTTNEVRSIEFDIAVTVEKTNVDSTKAGIKVFELIGAGGELSKESKNQQVSRIKFGVFVDGLSKDERRRQDDVVRKSFNNHI